jgi:hypothetical protein
MQPQKDVTVVHEHRPERLRGRGRQWIVCAVAAVIEQHGRKWPATRRTPHLCAQRECSASHVENFWRSCGLASRGDWPRGSGAEPNDADEENGARAFHHVLIYHVAAAHKPRVEPMCPLGRLVRLPEWVGLIGMLDLLDELSQARARVRRLAVLVECGREAVDADFHLLYLNEYPIATTAQSTFDKTLKS